MLEVKQIIVIRRDLKMRRGKEIAQGAHASSSWMVQQLLGRHFLTSVQRLWLSGKFTKITVQVNSETELLLLADLARYSGIDCHLIEDSGATEFAGIPTKTALALGPDYAFRLDPITGKLKLY